MVFVGQKAKYYIEYVTQNNQNAVVVFKYILTDKRITNKEVVNKLVKKFKGKFLYKQSMSFTKETYLQIATALLRTDN